MATCNLIESYAEDFIVIGENHFYGIHFITSDAITPIKNFDLSDIQSYQNLLEGQSCQFLIVGTGKSLLLPSKPVKEFLDAQNISYEFLSTRIACSTYNALCQERPDVALILIQ